MAHSLSAKKRIKQNEVRRQRNVARKGVMRTQIKKFRRAVEIGDADSAKKELPKCVSLIDKAAKAGVIHRRTADRSKSKLSKALEKVQVGK